MAFFAIFSFLGLHAFSQAVVQVQLVSVQISNNIDCDGWFNDSDFSFEYGATDNTLGYTNNNPAAFGLTGDFNFQYQNGNNGPWSNTTNSVFSTIYMLVLLMSQRKLILHGKVMRMMIHFSIGT